MKLRNRNVARVLAGIMLVVLAGGITYAIKELLSSRNPEAALPEIQITYAGTELPAEHWMMDSYSWRFLTITKRWEEPDRSRWINLTPAPVIPGMPIEVNFSYPCESIRVSRADVDPNSGQVPGEDDFREVSGKLTTPLDPGEGEYIFKIEANWGLKGSILYYFKVKISS